MWVWDQSSGSLSRGGKLVAYGYSGMAAAKNNPSLQAAKGLGPIPRGRWTMTAVRDSPNTGPFTIVLAPAPGTDTLGRSDFRIHGDSIAHPGLASHGCIILPRPIREMVWDSMDHELEVVE